MKVKELIEELKNFDSEARVMKAYGEMGITTSSKERVYRYLCYPLIGVSKGANGNCLMIFDRLKSDEDE